MPEDTLEARWHALAEKASGGSLDDLMHLTMDGLAIRPLYPRRTYDGPHLWRPTGAWRIAQRMDHPDPEAANRLALLDLEGGSDALTLVTSGSPYSRGFGLPPEANLEQAFQSIELDFIEMRLDTGSDCRAVASALGDIVQKRRLASAGLRIDLGFDPIGLAARTGTTPDLDALPHLLDLHRKAALAGCPLLSDGRPYHEAGSGPAQELAACLATAVAYIRALEGVGLDLDDARELIAVLLVADTDTFVSLAKFRAIRRLWARVGSGCGLTPKPLRIHAETAWRTMTRYDVWMNAMRATTGIFAAGLGGADMVTALPFTLPRGLPDANARRLTRNAQRVLIDESHLGAVDDPSAGAGAFEAMTDELCALAWGLFQEIETEGGIVASLAAGKLQKRIADTAKDRSTALVSLRAGLIGTNRFPSVDEPIMAVLDVPRRPECDPSPKGLPSMREAEPFEKLRDQIEAMADKPVVFLATLGAPVSFGPAASYAANFFAIAGLRTTPSECRDAAETQAAFKMSGAGVACICMSHTDQDRAPSLAAALRESGAVMVLYVGVRRSDDATPHDTDAFIHDGCDALATLAKVIEAASSSPS